MRLEATHPGCLSPTRTFTLRRSLERPAPACPAKVALPPPSRLSTPCSPTRTLADARDAGPRARARLPSGRASLDPGRRSSPSATDSDPRARPTSLRSSRANWVFTQPLSASPMPACVGLPMRRRNGPAGEPRSTPAHERGDRCGRGPNPASEGCVIANDGARPSSSEFGHPSRRGKCPRGLELPEGTLAPTRDTRTTTPRERRRRNGDRGAFRVDKTHTRSEANLRACPSRCPLTPPPQRNCSGANAPFWTGMNRPPLT